MKTIRLLGTTLLLLHIYAGQLYGQAHTKLERTARIRSHILDYWATLLSEGLMSEEVYEHSLEVLERLILEPLDINTATEEQLREIPLLSNYQIYHLIKARTDSGGFESVYDLKLLPGWTESTTQWILPLLSCRKQMDKGLRLWNEGRMHYALSVTQLSGRREERLGNSWGSSLRWGYRSRGGLSAFLGAELDRGEPWTYDRHIGFDSYAGHIAYRGSGRLKQVILGDYRTTWGEGLLIGQGLSFGRMDKSLVHSRTSSIRPISGVSEGNKLRGLAIEYQLGHWAFSSFVSRRRLDGKIKEGNKVFGLSENGLHRTPQQWYKRNRIPMNTLGVRIAYNREHLTLAVQHLHYHWRGLQISTPPSSRGVESLANLKQHSATSLSYTWHSTLGTTRLSGEVAKDALGNWANVHELSYRGDWAEIALSIRKLGSNYWSYFGSSALSIALRPHDEEGIRLSASSRELANGLEISGLLDLYRKPERYGNAVNRYSLINLAYTPSPSIELRGQWTEHTHPSNGSRRRLRLSTKLIEGEWALELGASRLLLSKQGTQPNESSYELDGRFKLQLSKSLQLWASIIYFDAPSWRTRLYGYEPRTRYDYNSVFLWGKGVRWSIGGKCQVKERLKLEMKIAHLNRGRLYPTERQLWLTLVYH